MKLLRPRDHAHALAAAAGDRLEQHREAELLRRFEQSRVVLMLAVIARHQRHPGRGGRRLGAVLGAHHLDRFRASAR